MISYHQRILDVMIDYPRNTPVHDSDETRPEEVER